MQEPSDSKLGDLLENKELEGIDVTCCEGFSHEGEVRGKLISLTRKKNTIVLSADIGGNIFESSIPIENLVVNKKKETILFDAYQNGGNVWSLGL